MKVYYSTIDGRSRGYVLLLILLAILSMGAFLFAYLMYTKGFYLTGMTNPVPWGLPIVIAVFFIGLSAGSLVLSSLATVFGRSEYKVFSRIAVYLAALLLTGGLISFIFDWGRIDRIFNPFLYYNPSSILSWNAILYTSYIVLCVLYLWAIFGERRGLVKTFGVLAVIWAIGVHSGTGIIFGFIYARELYHSALIPPSFIAAALSSGTALIILFIVGTFKYTGRSLDTRLITGLGRFLSGFIIVVLYFLLVEALYHLSIPATREATHFLLFGGNQYTIVYWVGLILVGSIIPLVILFNPRTKDSIPWIVLASALVVFGVLCERYIIVLPAQALPLTIFPGMHLSSPFMDGEVTRYMASPVEIGLAVGSSAIICFMYLLGLKLFALLPTEARYIKEGS